MILNINLNEVTDEISVACNTAIAKVSEWAGRAILVIKSGTQAALPYLQDKRVAVISLIAVNLLLYEVVDALSRLWNKYCPADTPLKRGFRDFVDILIPIGTIAAGVFGFAKYTRLPFSPGIIFVISAGTIILRAALAKD